MEVKVSIGNKDDQESILSCFEWLKQDPDVRSMSDIKLSGAHPQSESMAGDIDLISLLISSGFNFASLVFAIANWRATRQVAPSVRIDFKAVHVTIGDAGSADMEKMAAALSAARGDEAD
jgi:Effector Associated Constant Component 1